MLEEKAVQVALELERKQLRMGTCHKGLWRLLTVYDRPAEQYQLLGIKLDSVDCLSFWMKCKTEISRAFIVSLAPFNFYCSCSSRNL